ncbi:MAG: HDOD domain-containing protein [Proteobacteria bacterium]|jgi:HD-like signal output (HDOD) protein|nr:HDOD domain-containing protein [Pseudomonadota bacterium]
MNETGNRVLRGVSIPACPAILTQLMGELKSTSINSKKIALLVSQDAGFSAIVIRMANSPLLGNGCRISSITDAIETLGYDSLTNLVREAFLQDSINGNKLSLDRFWDNSRYTAIAGKRLASIVGRVNPDTAYTFGLFHDCGIPLLAQRYSEYKNVLREANKDAERIFTDVEEEALGTSHAIIGYYLARAWGLADAITQGILRHHDYAQLEDPLHINSEAHRLIAINVIAEYAASTHLRTVQDAEWMRAREAAAFCLGYAASDVDDLADDLIYQFDETLAHHEERG